MVSSSWKLNLFLASFLAFRFSLDWFLLGWQPKQYFEHSAMDIARHVLSLRAAKQLAKLSHSKHPFHDVHLDVEYDDRAMFATSSDISTSVEAGKALRMVPHVALSPVVKLERRIEDRFLSGQQRLPNHDDPVVRPDVPRESMSFTGKEADDRKSEVYRLQCIRSAGPIDPGSTKHLRLYFLQKPRFVEGTMPESESDIDRVGDEHFLGHTDENVLELYQRVLTRASEAMGPAIDTLPLFHGEESLVLVAHRIGSTHSYFTAVPQVYRYHNMYASRKYVEPFANNIVVFAFYLRLLDQPGQASPMAGDMSTMLSDRLAHIKRDIAMHYVLPRTSLTPLVNERNLSVEEVSSLIDSSQGGLAEIVGG